MASSETFFPPSDLPIAQSSPTYFLLQFQIPTDSSSSVGTLPNIYGNNSLEEFCTREYSSMVVKAH